jgi:hypothetical protein
MYNKLYNKQGGFNFFSMWYLDKGQGSPYEF